MNRRDSLKSLLVGTVGAGLVLQSCDPAVEKAQEIKKPESAVGHYGRTDKEKARDAALAEQQFFTVHELETVAVLCDLILPAKGAVGGAKDAGVADFIDFIVKDMPNHQFPIRGGIMWLDNRANRKFSQEFKALTETEQKKMLDEIAYPDKASPEVGQGVKFFSLMRNLTLTGYYTTKIGIDDLGYKGNSPNVWDGVPDDVLKQHGVEYEAEWLAKCVDQSKRNDTAEWDEAGNLIS